MRSMGAPDVQVVLDEVIRADVLDARTRGDGGRGGWALLTRGPQCRRGGRVNKGGCDRLGVLGDRHAVEGARGPGVADFAARV